MTEGRFEMKNTKISLLLTLAVCTGCTTYSRYTPQPDQAVVYENGVASVISQGSESTVRIQPVAPLQEDGTRHGFVLAVENTGDASVNIGPENVRFSYKGENLPILTYAARVTEIENKRRAIKIALAVAGALAAGASAYAASQSHYSSSGWVGRTAYHSTATFTDPLAGIVAGGAVAGGTIYGVNMADTAADLAKQGADGLLKMNTVAAGAFRSGIITPDDTLSSDSKARYPFDITVTVGADRHTIQFFQERAGR